MADAIWIQHLESKLYENDSIVNHHHDYNYTHHQTNKYIVYSYKILLIVIQLRYNSFPVNKHQSI